MFSLAAIKMKLIIGGIILAIILGLGWTAKHYYDANLLNEKAVERLAKANKDLDDQLIVFKKSKEIDDKTLLNQQTIINGLMDINKVDTRQVSLDVKKVLDKYYTLPKTPENNNIRDKEVSTIRILGLWKTYCTLHADNQTCVELKKEQDKK